MKYSKLQTSSCFTFYKGNEISANHNEEKKREKIQKVVSPSTKVMKFQLITTENKKIQKEFRLFHLLQR